MLHQFPAIYSCFEFSSWRRARIAMILAMTESSSSWSHNRIGAHQAVLVTSGSGYFKKSLNDIIATWKPSPPSNMIPTDYIGIDTYLRLVGGVAWGRLFFVFVGPGTTLLLFATLFAMCIPSYSHGSYEKHEDSTACTLNSGEMHPKTHFILFQILKW